MSNAQFFNSVARFKGKHLVAFEGAVWTINGSTVTTIPKELCEKAGITPGKKVQFLVMVGA